MIPGNWSPIADPAAEPISLAEAVLHLRVDNTADDALITALITAARQWVEHYIRRQLITATWALKLDSFPSGTSPILVPLPPLQSVESIDYIDEDGDTQSLDLGDSTPPTPEVRVLTASEPARIIPVYGSYWPIAQCDEQVITVSFTAGYGDDPADVPGPIRSAILLVIGDLYQNRTGQDEIKLNPNEAILRLLSPYRSEVFA